MQHLPKARLLIACPDRPGIVAAVSNWLYNRGANIVHSDQHSTDPMGGEFFMRLEFHLENMDRELDGFQADFGRDLGEPFQMRWRVSPCWKPRKTAILVSKTDHVLMDIIWRCRRGELETELSMVISNHKDLAHDVGALGVPFHHVEVNADNKAAAEERIMTLLSGRADLILLARYMQILSPDFVAAYHGRIINIHHSFLPAFVGADPYRRAAERGVKLIGATAHYVTQELDQGPIIEQDVIRVSHRHNVEDLKVLGRDIERQVMSRAVKWHLEDRILVNGNKTIVFA